MQHDRGRRQRSPLTPVALCREAWRRAHLQHLQAIMAHALGRPCPTAIVPIVVGAEAPTQRVAARLLRAGFHVPCIRPPTVPAGSSRLRVSLSAGHSTEQALALLRELRHALHEEGLPALAGRSAPLLAKL